MKTSGAKVSEGYVVECFWPGVTPAGHEDADRRVRSAVEELSREFGPLLYVGSLLVPEDEVVFLQFEATDPEICRTVARLAGIDYERVVQAVRLGGEPQPATVTAAAGTNQRAPKEER